MTKKQANVLYKAYKEGILICQEETINYIYKKNAYWNEAVYEEGGDWSIVNNVWGISQIKNDNNFFKEILEDYFNMEYAEMNKKIANWEKEEKKYIPTCGRKF